MSSLAGGQGSPNIAAYGNQGLQRHPRRRPLEGAGSPRGSTCSPASPARFSRRVIGRPRAADQRREHLEAAEVAEQTLRALGMDRWWFPGSSTSSRFRAHALPEQASRDRYHGEEHGRLVVTIFLGLITPLIAYVVINSQTSRSPRDA